LNRPSTSAIAPTSLPNGGCPAIGYQPR
jgi:hypothetical protein